MSECIQCGSFNTRLEREDGHIRKHCDDCRHIGGPYVSTQGEQTHGQKTLGDF